MNEIAMAYVAILSAAAGLAQVGQWLYELGDELPMEATIFIGAMMVSVARYCNITAIIIQDCHAEVPVLGRRCLFY